MNFYYFFPLFQTFFCLALVYVVLRSHYRSFTHRLFAADLLVLSGWGLVIFGMRISPDLEHAFHWEKWLVPLAPLMSVLGFHFAVRFTNTVLKRWILPILYIVLFTFLPLTVFDLVFTGMQIKPYGFAPIFGPAIPFWWGFIHVVTVMALVIFVRSYRRSVNFEYKNRITYIIIGIIITFIGGAFDLLPVFGFPLYPGGIISIIIFCSLTTIAIVKHKLLDINVALRKSMAYALLSTTIAAPFVGAFILLTNFSVEREISFWIYFILLLLLALIIPKLWQMVQERVDRWFYRGRYNYLRALETFSLEAQSLTDSAKLGKTAVTLLAGALRSSIVCLLQPSSPYGDFKTTSSIGMNSLESNVVLRNQSALIKWLWRSNALLSYDDDIDTIPQLQGVTEKEKESLQNIGTKIIAPLKTCNGQLGGLFIFGQKLSEQSYTIEDKQLIHAMTGQMAINLENVRLYDESRREIAERKQAEERERKLQQELNLTSRLASVGELAAGVAHEINNPLTGILGYAELLKRKAKDAEVKRRLELIHSEALRAAKVVENLRTFARRREPNKEIFDINDILNKALEMRIYELKTSNIQVIKELSSFLPPVKVDFHQIQQVFLNIIVNAGQAMVEANRGGTLIIKTENVNGNIRVTFHDDGPGISTEHINRIFDPFFTTRDEKGGTGLGLSICHGIVSGHDGKIFVSSELGKGTTFFVEFPIYTNDEENLDNH